MSNKQVVNIFAYTNATAGGSALTKYMHQEEILGKPRILRHENSKYVASKNKIVINWGSSNIPDFVYPSKIINKPEAVSIASNKLLFFRNCQEKGEAGPRVPDWTQDKAVVSSWINTKGNRGVFARTILRGNSGEGIVDIQTDEDLNKVPDNTLFVKYIPKKLEWRVHVTSSRDVFIVQRKARRETQEGNPLGPITPNWRVRNLQNGFVFERNGDLRPDPDVIEQAHRAVVSCGLDFGAVDVIWNEKKGAFVLEVNTAPGLEGSSIVDYANMFQRMLGEANG